MTRRLALPLLAALAGAAIASLVWARLCGPVDDATVRTLEARVDSLREAGAVQTLATADALAAYEAERVARETAELDRIAADREVARLRARLRPAAALAAATPDTCRPVVADLTEQLALRDSVIAALDARLASADSAVAAWDRVAAGLAVAAVAEHQLRVTAETTAKDALAALTRQRAPRLVLTGEALAGVDGDDVARLGLEARLWRVPLRVEREWRPGEAPVHRVGARIAVRLL